MMLNTIINRISILAKSILKPKFIQPYWVEISTQQPNCIYHFGAFDNRTEAKQIRRGYIEDLVTENVIGINAKIKRCMLTNLTISKEESLF